MLLLLNDVIKWDRSRGDLIYTLKAPCLLIRFLNYFFRVSDEPPSVVKPGGGVKPPPTQPALRVFTNLDNIFIYIRYISIRIILKKNIN